VPAAAEREGGAAMNDRAALLSRSDTAPRCGCGQPVTMHDSECPTCGSALGFDPLLRRVLALLPARDEGWWLEVEGNTHKRSLHYRRRANFGSAADCNWLLDANDLTLGERCRSCRLTGRLPDLAQPDDGRRWRLIEQAKRTLVSSLLALRLPLQSKARMPSAGSPSASTAASPPIPSGASTKSISMRRPMRAAHNSSTCSTSGLN